MIKIRYEEIEKNVPSINTFYTPFENEVHTITMSFSIYKKDDYFFMEEYIDREKKLYETHNKTGLLVFFRPIHRSYRKYENENNCFFIAEHFIPAKLVRLNKLKSLKMVI